MGRASCQLPRPWLRKCYQSWIKPTIQFIVEEAIEAGIEDILIVTGKSKRPIEDHFDSNIELEEHLRKQGKDDLLELVKPTNVNSVDRKSVV